jgi:putative DNA primase/helicase
MMTQTENPADVASGGPGMEYDTPKYYGDAAALSSFIDAIEAAGLTPPADIVVDGSIRRFSPNGDKSDLAAYYCLHDHGDGFTAGFFGCWRSGHYQVWTSKPDHELTPGQRQEYRQRIEKLKADAEAERKKKAATASRQAASIWESAKPATEDHPYLTNKGIKPHGARIDDRGCLLIPVMGLSGNIQSIQYIDGDGGKKFHPGGIIKGNFWRIDGKGDTIIICEGYATAVTCREATGATVIIAFNAGNLRPVAEAIRNAYPDKQIIIAADDDRSTPGNPGLTKGRDAAKAIGAALVYPEFQDNEPGSDFNDLAALHGLDAVRDRVQGAAADTWPEPLPLSNSYDPEPFPIEALPPIFRNAVEEVGAYVQAPIPMIISSALGAASIAIQGHYDVKRDDGLTGPVSLFLWVVADSGERKTTVDNYFTSGIRAYESQKRQEMQPEIDAYERELKIYKAKEDGLLLAIKNAKASEGKANG